MSGVIRLTWQATQKNKISGYYDRQNKSRGHWGIDADTPPEASAIQETPLSYTGNIKWTSPFTSRLLFEAGFSQYYQEYDELYQPSVTPTTYLIEDQRSGSICCAYTSQQYHFSTLRTYSTKLSYVTGTHNLSGGWTVSEGPRRLVTERTGDLTMRFGTTTVNADETGFGPNRVSLLLPEDQREGIYMDSGLWINDKFTFKRATVTAGLRFDWFIGEVNESTIPANRWTPAITYPGFKNVPNWKDLSPRLGLAYDLFGNGKTALKGSVSRYVDAQTVAFAASTNPINRVDTSENLTWTDNNRDFTIFNADGSVQDRDFNPNTTDNELAPIPGSSTFGEFVPSQTRIDPAISEGWFVRGYQWEFTGGIQHELVPRVSVTFNYYKRYTGGNETDTDNVNIGPEHYRGPFCIDTPSDSRLPDGGGFQVCDVYDLTQNAEDNIEADNFTSFLSTFGVEPIQYNHGYELTLNARLPNGTFIQGGVSADRSVNDDCYNAILDSPQAAMVNPITGRQFCHDVTPFRPDVKLLASHTLPWDIMFSGTYQYVSGPSILGSWTFSQSAANAAGFSLTAPSGATTAQRLAETRTLQLLQTGQSYAPGMNQLDLRAAKRFNFGGRARLQFMVDLYNVFNSDWVFAQNNTVGTNYTVRDTYLRPTRVIQARLLKVGAQIDF